ncbi:MAG: hypothetical protein QNJ07_16485, partial [Woeseiaceae bacterium]|nr:hypothetical protein [Woeseiaceae bacterium]
VGIHGSGAQGIHGSGTTGIHGSGALGIHGSGVVGIHGSGAQGIHGSGTTGIHGSGALGIHGSGVEGIHGSGVTVAEPIASLVLAGPVEHLDLENGVFMAVGQTVMASGSVLDGLQAGNYVAVTGTVMGSGLIYADVVESFSNYTPGADTVFVAGIPSEIDELTGRAYMGDLEIDFTSAIGQFDHSKSGLWEISGVQPNLKGLLISDSVSDY